jgi:hypothetical protein
MKALRIDHISGLAFIAFGVAVFALSGDLPFGTLSFPGSGFLPKLVAALLIVFGLALALRARESEPLASLEWTDLRHAGTVVALAAGGIALYTVAGFLIAIGLMLFAVLVLIERKGILPAALYSVLLTGATWFLFERLLRTPLPNGPFGF